jgi:palmitoyl-protein thioesterase
MFASVLPFQTVEPRQSSWFASYPVAEDDEDDGSRKQNTTEVLPLRQSDIYKQDWVGLKSLDKRGALLLELCHGIHMQIDSACQMKVFGKYVGIAPPSSLLPKTIRHGWERGLYTVTGLRNTTPALLQLILLLTTVLLLQAMYTGATSLVRRKRESNSVRLV